MTKTSDTLTRGRFIAAAHFVKPAARPLIASSISLMTNGRIPVQPRSGKKRQPWGLSSEDGLQGSESKGEDLEGAEFESAAKSSDEETSQDRRMFDDATQEEENPVIAHGQYEQWTPIPRVSPSFWRGVLSGGRRMRQPSNFGQGAGPV
jgi:hypothetical protein